MGPIFEARATVAVDGKTLRGAVRTDGRRGHLLSALRGDGIILAQREVDAKSNKITVFRPLLHPLGGLSSASSRVKGKQAE